MKRRESNRFFAGTMDANVTRVYQRDDAKLRRVDASIRECSAYVRDDANLITSTP